MTRRKVVVSPAARTDLIGIYEYIAERSPVAAEKTIDHITLAAAGLGEAAFHYPVVPGRPEAGVRRRVVDRFNIYFTVTDEAVTVVRVLHGARDVDVTLFGSSDD